MILEIDELVKRLYQWGQGGSSPPIMCKLFFFHLSNEDKKEEYGISVKKNNEGKKLENDSVRSQYGEDEMLGLLKHLRSIGVRHFKLLVDNDNFYSTQYLIRTVELLKESGAELTISSRGLELSKNDVKELVMAGVNSFEFQVFGHDENTHFAGNVKNGNWRRIDETLNHLNHFLTERKDNQIGVHIHIGLTNNNWNKIPNIIRYSLRKNIDSINWFVLDKSINSQYEIPKIKHRKDLLLMKDDLINMCSLYGLKNNLDHVLTDRLLFQKRDDKQTIKSESKSPRKHHQFENIISRFKNRFTEMDESFIRFAIQQSYQVWYCMNLGPEGFLIPSIDHFVIYRPIDPSTEVLEKLWFGGSFEIERERQLKEFSNNAIDNDLIKIKEIQSRLLKNWAKEKKMKPQNLLNHENIVKEYKNREIKTQMNILDKDIEWLENKKKDLDNRIELYGVDKYTIDNLSKSHTFKIAKTIFRL